jgi:uncharacterized membrane protein
MRRTIRATLPLAAALLLAGCGPTRAPAPAADGTPQRDAERIVEDVLLKTRLEVAERRIAQLERQVAEMSAAPANVEVDLLRQRLAGTEAALAASAAPIPVATPSPRATPSPAATATPRPQSAPRTQPTAAATPRAQPTPRLRLVPPSEFQPQPR